MSHLNSFLTMDCPYLHMYISVFTQHLIIVLLKGMEHVPNIFMSYKYLFLEVINILI